MPLKHKKSKEYSNLKLQTQFSDQDEGPKLKELKAMYPETESNKGSVLVRKNTLLLENNEIEDDILYNISCEEVGLKKKLRERLDRLLTSAMGHQEIGSGEAKHLLQLFNYVGEA